MGCIRVRFILAALSFLAYVIIYSHRVDLSVAIVTMINHTAMNDLQPNATSGCFQSLPNATDEEASNVIDGEYLWTSSQKGIVLGAFFYGYVVTQLPGGRLAEIIGGKWLMGGGVLLTSIITMLAPLFASWGYLAFAASRFIAGFGEGVTFPALFAILSHWAPINERTFMVGMAICGSHVGTVMTMPVSSALASSTFLKGWPAIFYLFGLLGIIWCILWACLITNTPEGHPCISMEELKYIQKTRESGETHKDFPWKKLFTSKAVLICSFYKFTTSWGFITLLTYLPEYMASVLLFPLDKKGYLNAVPYIVDAIMTIVSSLTADYLRKKKIFGITTIRKLLIGIGTVGIIICLCLVPFIGCDGYKTLALFTLALGSYGILSGGDNPLILDITPDYAGTVCGLANAISNAAGMIAPPIAGLLTQTNDIDHWSHVFYLSSLIIAVGVLTFMFFGTADPEPWASHETVGTSPSYLNSEVEPLLRSERLKTMT